MNPGATHGTLLEAQAAVETGGEVSTRQKEHVPLNIKAHYAWFLFLCLCFCFIKVRALALELFAHLIDVLRTDELLNVLTLGKPARMFFVWVVMVAPVIEAAVAKITFNHIPDAKIKETGAHKVHRLLAHGGWPIAKTVDALLYVGVSKMMCKYSHQIFWFILMQRNHFLFPFDDALLINQLFKKIKVSKKNVNVRQKKKE